MNFNPQEPFALADLPPKTGLETSAILKTLVAASREVGELKGYYVPNPKVLMSLAMTKESVESSLIEDIVTTVENVFQAQLFPDSETKSADKEVLRYREAMHWGMENLNNYSISTRLILGIHKNLIPKSSGYRKQQNAIMNQRTSEVVYTPPQANNIDRHLQNWEDFVNENAIDPMDPLLKCAVAHYQFEAIHPFIDGNGRTGRILLALQMVQEGLLRFPVLYISGYLNRNRSEYYSRIRGITERGDWENFILFMLQGFQMQAMKTKLRLFEMMEVHAKIKEIISNNHKKMKSGEVTDHLFSALVTTPTLFSTALGVHFQTAKKHLDELRDAGLLFNEKKRQDQ